MGFKQLIQASPIANYGKAIRAAPREVIFNRQLLLSCVLYAMSAVPVSESSKKKRSRSRLASNAKSLTLTSQRGIKGHHLSSHRFQDSKSTSGSAPGPMQSRSAILLPLYTSDWQSVLLSLSFSMTASGDFGPFVCIAWSGLLGSLWPRFLQGLRGCILLGS